MRLGIMHYAKFPCCLCRPRARQWVLAVGAALLLHAQKQRLAASETAEALQPYGHCS